jgi:hypothetical protein
VTLAGHHGYDAMDYRINVDWYRNVLFFSTFGILGAVTLTYLVTVVWQAGQCRGTYTPSPALDRLGAVAIGLLLFWIVSYFAVGFSVWAR